METIDIQALFKAYCDGEVDLICVVGPTASGKTAYAVELARKLAQCALRAMPLVAPTEKIVAPTEPFVAPAPPFVVSYIPEILSADSRQVYRGMTIGTGKDLGEYEEIPYHLIDIVPAGAKYNIYEYQRDFEKAYADIRSRGAIPILCGGSGLYVEAATRAYSLPNVPPNPELREQLEKQDTDSLIAQLASLKTLHNHTDYDTRKRLIRALEIAIYEAEHPVIRSNNLPKNPYYIGISVDRDERNRRIDKRLDLRLQEGMIDEVRALLNSGIAPEDLIYYGLEYKFVTLYLIGDLTYDQMRLGLQTAIHQFAKRQMTWFRGMERKGCHIHWTAFDHLK